jgi:hypothetical protein
VSLEAIATSIRHRIVLLPLRSNVVSEGLLAYERRCQLTSYSNARSWYYRGVLPAFHHSIVVSTVKN